MPLEDKKPIFGSTQKFLARRYHTTEAKAVHVSPGRVISMSLFVLLLEFNPYQRRVAVVILGIDVGSLG